MFKIAMVLLVRLIVVMVVCQPEGGDLRGRFANSGIDVNEQLPQLRTPPLMLQVGAAGGGGGGGGELPLPPLPPLPPPIIIEFTFQRTLLLRSQ